MSAADARELSISDAYLPLHHAKSLCRMTREYLWHDAQSANKERAQRAGDAGFALDSLMTAIDEAFRLLEKVEVREMAAANAARKEV